MNIPEGEYTQVKIGDKRYRIIFKDDWFYPQIKTLFSWAGIKALDEYGNATVARAYSIKTAMIIIKLHSKTKF